MKTENKKFYEVLLGILLIIIAVLSVQLIINNKELIIGKVAYANIGCCDLNCQDTSLNNCPNNFNPGKKCNELPQCNIGCCVDFEDYCLDNYLKSNCDNKGMFHSTIVNANSIQTF